LAKQRSSFEKRQRERSKRERRERKAQRKADRKAGAESGEPIIDEETGEVIEVVDAEGEVGEESEAQEDLSGVESGGSQNGEGDRAND
jgi:NTP pyrophosphatase (non-canonical NTP hydrolase)